MSGVSLDFCYTVVIWHCGTDDHRDETVIALFVALSNVSKRIKKEMFVSMDYLGIHLKSGELAKMTRICS